MTTHTVGPPLVGRQLHSQPPRGSPSGTSSDDGLVMAGTLALPAGNGPPAAVVLLCPGRLDRDGDVGKARIVSAGRWPQRSPQGGGVLPLRPPRRRCHAGGPAGDRGLPASA